MLVDVDRWHQPEAVEDPPWQPVPLSGQLPYPADLSADAFGH